MPTTDALFVLNNLQAVNNPSNTVGTLPQVLAVEPQVALQLSGRLPGGAAYRGEVNAVSPNTTNAYILLGATETAGQMGYTKSGAFAVNLVNTTNATIQLTNTAVNTNSVAGDTSFNTWNRIYLFNASGLEGHNAASIKVGPSNTNGNGLLLGSTAGTFNNLTVDGASRHIIQSTNGVVVNAANSALLITPTANSTLVAVVYGS